MLLKPLDIVLVSGQGDISTLIKFFEKKPDDIGKVRASHTGVISTGGDLSQAKIAEADGSWFSANPMAKYADGRSQLTIFRPISLTRVQAEACTKKMLLLLSSRPYYDYANLPLHAIDWALSWALYGLSAGRVREDVYAFRRLTSVSPLPICSKAVGEIFGAANLWFGAPIGKLEPEDILRFCAAHPQHDMLVYQGVLPKVA